MLRVSNVLNRYFKQKKILKYFSLPHGEYIIEYKKDDKIETTRIKFNELDNINDIEKKINEVIEWIFTKKLLKLKMNVKVGKIVINVNILIIVQKLKFYFIVLHMRI